MFKDCALKPGEVHWTEYENEIMNRFLVTVPNSKINAHNTGCNFGEYFLIETKMTWYEYDEMALTYYVLYIW